MSETDDDSVCSDNEGEGVLIEHEDMHGMCYTLRSSKGNVFYAEDSAAEEHEPVVKEHESDYEAGVDTELIDHEDFAHVLSDGTQYRIDEAQVHRLFDALCMCNATYSLSHMSQL